MTRPIEVEVWEFDLAGTYELAYVDKLSSDSKREWLDDLTDVGSYSLEIKVGHADEALCADGRFLRFLLNGIPRWWGVIDLPKAKTFADPNNRESGRVIKISGRGGLSLLEFAPLYPELGLGRVSPDTRYFNFASLDYDDTSWGNAVELKQQNDPDDTKPWYNAPRKWEDPNAWWVGPTDGDVPPTDPGDAYFRGTFTVASGQGGEYRFFLTADDEFELYVDGDRVIVKHGVGLWGVTHYYDALLDEGSHLIAAKATNLDRPVAATNVFGFICSVFKLNGGGQTLGPLVSGTSSGTKMLAYPAAAPGMTPGHILQIAFYEAFFLYALLDPVNYDFDDVVDSNGVDWPTEFDLSFTVGAAMLEMGRKLIAEKACDLWVDPAITDYITVRAFIEKGDDLTSGPGMVEISYGENIGELGHDHTPPGINSLLSRTAEGRWVETTDAAAVATWGKRGGFMSQGSAPSNDAAIRQAETFIADTAEPADVIRQVRVEVVPGGPVPYEDFTTGDRILAPSFDGTPAPFRVTGIRVSEDTAGQPIYDLDLETP